MNIMQNRAKLPQMNPNAPANPVRDQLAMAAGAAGAEEIEQRILARGMMFPLALAGAFEGVIAAAFCCGWDIATELAAEGGAEGVAGGVDPAAAPVDNTPGAGVN